MFPAPPVHPLMHNYPGASFTHPFGPVPPLHPGIPAHGNGNVNGPYLAQLAGGNSFGYWAQVPPDYPSEPPTQWTLPPAIQAAIEGRGTGVYGLPVGGQGSPFNYGWPKYGPVSSLISFRTSRDEAVSCGADQEQMPLKPELGGYGECCPVPSRYSLSYCSPSHLLPRGARCRLWFLVFDADMSQSASSTRTVGVTRTVSGRR